MKKDETAYYEIPGRNAQPENQMPTQSKVNIIGEYETMEEHNYPRHYLNLTNCKPTSMLPWHLIDE